ncbi:MAG: IS1634 family transposase [Clostridia bacterium]|nr:IS1634 family transposase [Clostridia bacterium]
MAFSLRQTHKKNDIYLQIYENYWDKELKQPRNRHIESLGYVSDLISEDIPDPVVHFKAVVENMNRQRTEEFDEKTRPRAFTANVEKNVGYFLIHALIEELNVKEVVDILASARQFQFSLYDMLTQLIFARVICPCSKSASVSNVFPMLYRYSQMSEDQVYDGLFFMGSFYNKYIELFNYAYEKHFKRNFKNVFFDCTNYYFEIDRPYEDKQKGPSKENRSEPIIGQAMLLDGDLVPIAMQMFPGNNSEKPYIRKTIEEMKQRYKVEGRTIQVADKGLNCARNIYAAVIESKDGYIFSKSIHGTGLNDIEKQWLLLENEENVFTDYRDSNNTLLFRIKECVDTFSYTFNEIDPESGKKESITFHVKEKRIVSFNPSLANKQRAEITRMAEKASGFISYKKYSREEIGDSAKYIVIDNKGKNNTAPIYKLNNAKIQEDLKYAGYNLIVTSETDMPALKVYQTYHSLWKIEESFRITKSFLDARPVYVQKRETIYGHFLICYLCLFLLRLLEIKCFDNKVNAYDLINFIRDFRIVDKGNNQYINISSNRQLNETIKKLTGLTNLDALVLTKKEVDNLFDNSMIIPSKVL